MTWAKLDDAIIDNPKIRKAGVYGFAMHVAAITWCCRNLTDGFVPLGVPEGLLPLSRVQIDAANPLALPGGPRSPSGQEGLNPQLIIDKLIEVGLWDEVEGGYQIHDFLEYNPSRNDVLGRREKERSRKKSQRKSSRTPRSVPPGHPEGRGTESDASCAHPVPVPVPKEEDLPPPPRRSNPDYFALSLTSLRPDVVRLHEAYKRRFGLAGHKLKNAADPNAVDLASAIDQVGIETCLAVIEVAPEDPMVSGKADERGQKHEKISYLFGNPDTFARLLRAVEQRKKRANRPNIDQAFDAAMNAEPEA